MNKIIFLPLITIIILSFSNDGGRKQSEYKNASIKCSYETYEGRIDGNYISYYKNGKKKAEGKFENNYRTGSWTVWDSTGKIRIERYYENPFCFKSISPKAPNDKPITLLNIPRYSIQYNKDGYINYFHLEERMVHWSKRIWRFVTPQENPVLFKNNRLINLFNKNIFNGTLTVYSTKDDIYTTELTIAEIDTSSIKIIGYKIKEDSFLDNERFVFETRIIGICPVGINKKTNDTINLYWIYFPQIRKTLAQEKIQLEGTIAKIKTLDDLFFYRYFSGQIYKESNVYNREIKDYKSGLKIAIEAEAIEINMIENEHDIWISFNR